MTVQRLNGQLPIKVHSTTIPERYLHSTFRREQPVIAPLRPKYWSGQRTLSLDGNALLVNAIYHYCKHLDDDILLNKNWAALKMATDWLRELAPDADRLLHQGAFSNGADTLAR